jgi:MFS family permease
VLHLKQLFLHPAARATGIIFALCGLVFGVWASFIPYVKDKFHLDEAQLGLLLLCMPVGTLIANALSVYFISRWGAVWTALVFIVMMAVTFTFPILAPSIWLVGFGLVLGGATFAAGNIAMNTCASDLEEEHGLKIMSACHGMWSLGAMIGAFISGLSVIGFNKFFGAWINPYLLFEMLVALGTFLIVWFIRKDLQLIHENWEKNKHPSGSPISIYKPTRILWILISISLCTFLTEGTIADWSAVYLKDIIGAPEAVAGWGFGLYAFFMAMGRFLGDGLISRYGNMKIFMIAGILVVMGLSVIILSANLWLALPGFMLTGLGISVASPILYAAAARVPGLPPGAGLATLNSFGMTAFLGGPVLIGFIAQLSNLRIAFLFVAAAAVLWVFQTAMLVRKNIAP